MKKNCYCIFFATLFSFAVQAQEQLPGKRKISSLQLELAGVYNLAGISFDQRFTGNYSGFGYKMGLGAGFSKNGWTFFPFKFNPWSGFPSQTIVSAPLQINYLAGAKNHQFEAGAGITPFYSTYKFNGKSNINAFGTLSSGYRYHNLPKHFLIGAGLVFGYKLPGLEMEYVDNFFWQPYLTIGHIIN